MAASTDTQNPPPHKLQCSHKRMLRQMHPHTSLSYSVPLPKTMRMGLWLNSIPANTKHVSQGMCIQRCILRHEVWAMLCFSLTELFFPCYSESKPFARCSLLRQRGGALNVLSVSLGVCRAEPVAGVLSDLAVSSVLQCCWSSRLPSQFIAEDDELKRPKLKNRVLHTICFSFSIIFRTRFRGNVRLRLCVHWDWHRSLGFAWYCKTWRS